MDAKLSPRDALLQEVMDSLHFEFERALVYWIISLFDRLHAAKKLAPRAKGSLRERLRMALTQANSFAQIHVLYYLTYSRRLAHYRELDSGTGRALSLSNIRVGYTREEIFYLQLRTIILRIEAQIRRSGDPTEYPFLLQSVPDEMLQRIVTLLRQSPIESAAPFVIIDLGHVEWIDELAEVCQGIAEKIDDDAAKPVFRLARSFERDAKYLRRTSIPIYFYLVTRVHTYEPRFGFGPSPAQLPSRPTLTSFEVLARISQIAILDRED